MLPFAKTPRPVADRPIHCATGTQLLVLAFATCLCLGCGDSDASQHAEQQKQLPKTQFEWGMERLDRALRFSRPSTADGLFTERSMTYKLVEPVSGDDSYTATVTVTTAAEFIHGKRTVPEKKTAEPQTEEDPDSQDLLSDKSDEMTKLLDLPGAGPNAPAVPTPIIEPRSLDSEAVFDLAYADGKWKLLTEPEHKYEKMWFEYAFPE